MLNHLSSHHDEFDSKRSSFKDKVVWIICKSVTLYNIFSADRLTFRELILENSLFIENFVQKKMQRSWENESVYRVISLTDVYWVTFIYLLKDEEN